MNVSYLFLAPGFEEMEAIAVVDVLRSCLLYTSDAADE